MRVKLHLDWDRGLGEAPPLERRIEGFDALKKRLAAASDEPLDMHAFTYAFLRRAKNVDLFVEADDTEIRDRLAKLRRERDALEAFERDGDRPEGDAAGLVPAYLALRPVMVRAGARDERRALVHILMNGPCSDTDLASDLGISENLAIRIRKALRPVMGETGDGRHAIRPEALPVALFAVHERTGIDPLAALD